MRISEKRRICGYEGESEFCRPREIHWDQWDREKRWENSQKDPYSLELLDSLIDV